MFLTIVRGTARRLAVTSTDLFGFSLFGVPSYSRSTNTTCLLVLVRGLSQVLDPSDFHVGGSVPPICRVWSSSQTGENLGSLGSKSSRLTPQTTQEISRAHVPACVLRAESLQPSRRLQALSLPCHFIRACHPLWPFCSGGS